MYRAREDILHKEQINVVLYMANITMKGTIYVGGYERVSDLLNGPHSFLPLEVDGAMRMVSKSSIDWIEPEDADRMKMATPGPTTEDKRYIG